MPSQREQRLAVLPNAYQSVVPAACSEVSVRGERHAAQYAAPSLKFGELLTALGLPQAYRTIVTPACQKLPVRAKRHAEDRARAPVQSAERPAAIGLPQP